MAANSFRKTLGISSLIVVAAASNLLYQNCSKVDFAKQQDSSNNPFLVGGGTTTTGFGVTTTTFASGVGCGHALRVSYVSQVVSPFSVGIVLIDSSQNPLIPYYWNQANGRMHNDCGNPCGNAIRNNADAVQMVLLRASGKSIVGCRVRNNLDDATWVSCESGWIDILNQNRIFRLNVDDIQVDPSQSPKCTYSANPRLDLDPATATPDHSHFALELTDSLGCVESLQYDFKWMGQTPANRYTTTCP